MPFVLVRWSDEAAERKFAVFGASQNAGVKPAKQILMCSAQAADANIPFWQSHNGIFVELAFGEFGGPNPGGGYHNIEFVTSVPPPPIFRFGAKRNIAITSEFPYP